ncbi:ThuA domain-containing protein [Mucilaginibacter sp. HD30]
MINFTKYYRLICSVSLIAAIAITASCSSAKKGSSKSNKVLVFHKIGVNDKGVRAYPHASRIPGSIAIMKLGTQNNFVADTTSDENKFTPENLKQYAAVIFISTTGAHILNDAHKAAFTSYIQHGGGYVGIHAASDGEYDWAWYGKLVGAYFKAHPQGTPTETIDVVDRTSAATKMLPARWERKDEWYAYRALPQDVHVLLNLDESSAAPEVYTRSPQAKMGANHPLAWWHDYDGGRAFYTALGHTDSSYEEPLFLQHLLAGIEYAMGRKKM